MMHGRRPSCHDIRSDKPCADRGYGRLQPLQSKLQIPVWPGLEHRCDALGKHTQGIRLQQMVAFPYKTFRHHDDMDDSKRQHPTSSRTFLRRILPTGLLAVMLLAGCASAGDKMHKAMQAVGLSKPDPAAASQVSVPIETKIPLRIYAGTNLNAGQGRKPLALVVKIYHLRSSDRFEHVPFDTFLDNAREHQALGDALIDSHEMLVLPDQHYVTEEKMPAGTHYIGVVALFRSPAARRWRFLYDVEASKKSGITIGAHACAMSSTAGELLTSLMNDPASLSSVQCPAIGK